MKRKQPKRKDPKPNEVSGKTTTHITVEQLKKAGYTLDIDANGCMWIVKAK